MPQISFEECYSLEYQPRLRDLVLSTLGRLDPEDSRSLSRLAAESDLIRERLFVVFQKVRALRESEGFSLVSPGDDPFLFEVDRELRSILGTDRSEEKNDSVRERFIGRKSELAEIQDWFEGKKQVVLLTGAGGVGKTFLLARVFEGQAPDSNPVWLDCNSVQTKEEFYVALARSLDYEKEKDLKSEILAHLAQHPIALFLDGIDGLLLLESELKEIVAQSNRIKVLCTSREASMAGATVFSLAPLETEGEGSDPSEAELLMLQSVKNVTKDFTNSALNVRLTREISRLTQGIPLAMCIAAGCLTNMTLSEVALDLQNLLRSVNQTSVQPLETVLQRTFHLLSQQQSEILAVLSVFPDDFNYEDAQRVAGAPDTAFSKHISDLIACALVHVEIQNGVARYRLHDVAREYGRSFFESEAGQVRSDILVNRHSFIYALRAEHIGFLFKAGDWLEGTRHLAEEGRNLREGMRAAIKNGDRIGIRRYADGLARSYFESGALSDFEFISEAAIALNEIDLSVRMLGLKGALASLQGNREAARSLWQERLELCRSIDHVAGSADCLADLSWHAFEDGEFELALELIDEAERISTEAGLFDWVASAHMVRALIYLESGDRERALASADAARSTLGEGRNRALLPFVYQTMAKVYVELGLDDLAISSLQTLLSISYEGRRSIHISRALVRLAGVYEGRDEIRTALRCYVAAMGAMNEYSTRDRRHTGEALAAFCERHKISQGELDRLMSSPWEEFVRSLIVP